MKNIVVPQIVVTRHPALVTVLIEDGLVDIDTPVLAHATPEQIEFKHVFGVLPLHLAVHAKMVTEILLNLPEELRGKELSIPELRKYMGPPRTYQVREVTRQGHRPKLSLSEAAYRQIPS